MKDNAVIPFKSNAGISYALTQRLLYKGKQYGLTAIFPFNPEKVTVAEWVRLKCEYGCSRYNTNWT